MGKNINAASQSHFVPTTHERLLKDPVCYELEKINHDKGGGKGAGGGGGGGMSPPLPLPSTAFLIHSSQSSEG